MTKRERERLRKLVARMQAGFFGDHGWEDAAEALLELVRWLQQEGAP